MKFIRIKLDGGKMPTKGTPGSAAWDLYAISDGTIWPGSMETLHLGFSLQLQDCAAILSHRSGLNIHYGIQAYGLIDPDYRGEAMICLHNTGVITYNYMKGDRIGQMRLVEVPEASLLVTQELTETERGEGGHGSTGS